MKSRKTSKKTVRPPVAKRPLVTRSRPAAGKAAKPKDAKPPRPRPQNGNGGAVAAPAASVTLHVLSDSTGNLAQHMLTAFLTQFPGDAFSIRRRNFLQTPSALQDALKDVAANPGIVFHALVSKEFKKMVADTCKALSLACCDLTGQFVDFLARESGIEPKQDVARLHDISHEYRQRIKALEFTLEHDDALGLETLHEADIVLAGVSRTSKTPTSVYLAQQGYRVGNVSLAYGIDPPKQLLELKTNVIGLVIDADQLVEIRTNRQVDWRMGDTRYNDPEYVAREIAWSRRLFAQQGWPIINVTHRAVEETAGRIVDILGVGSKE